jgi:uncharacterized phiE125 gp8 family phage protein
LTVVEIERHLELDALNKEPVPSAPIAALAGTGAGNVDNGVHRYRVTFVTADGETDGGDISAAVTVADKNVNGQISITTISLGGSFVVARNLYRTMANGSSYFLVAAIANNTTTVFIDTVADSALGVGIPSTNTTGDPRLLALQQRSRRHLEAHYGRAFLTQTWRYTLDRFPGAWCGNLWPSMSAGPFGVIELPMPVLQSVSSITYVDNDGVTQTLSTSVYDVDVDHFPGRVLLKYGQVWPVTRVQRNAVTITLVAGYASPALVPADWKHALLLLIAHFYQHRGDENMPMPDNIDSLMYPDRYIEVA